MTNNATDIGKETKGVKLILGEPEKAIRRLSLPMMIAMLAQTLYNISDGIWVAGLGTSELAAIGLFFPLYMIIISFGSGISVGGSSAISRKIGAKYKEKADSAAIHTLLLGLGVAIILTVFGIIFLKPIFDKMGANPSVVKDTIAYGNIIIWSTILLIFNNLASGILRGEGDTKRVMYAMVMSAILNIGLDPIFIYVLKMGIKGAAWATVASVFVTSIIITRWLFLKKNTYVEFNFHKFRIDWQIIKEILRVGVPASLAQMAMAFAIFIINYIIIKVAGQNGIATFTSAWRIIMIGLVPLIGISMGVTAVVGAAFGAKDIKKLNTGYIYSIKYGVMIEVIIVILIFIFAKQLAFLFSYSKDTSVLSQSLTYTLRVLVLFLPTVPLGMFTSSMFQGIGKGENSLMMTIMRTLIFQIIFGYILGIVFNFGLPGVCWGIAIGNITASFIGFAWGKYEINRLYKKA